MIPVDGSTRTLPFASGYLNRRVGVYSMREAVAPEDLLKIKKGLRSGAPKSLVTC